MLKAFCRKLRPRFRALIYRLLLYFTSDGQQSKKGMRDLFVGLVLPGHLSVSLRI
jgi:hypothetical protein